MSIPILGSAAVRQVQNSTSGVFFHRLAVFDAGSLEVNIDMGHPHHGMVRLQKRLSRECFRAATRPMTIRSGLDEPCIVPTARSPGRRAKTAGTPQGDCLLQSELPIHAFHREKATAATVARRFQTPTCGMMDAMVGRPRWNEAVIVVAAKRLVRWGVPSQTLCGSRAKGGMAVHPCAWAMAASVAWFELVPVGVEGVGLASCNGRQMLMPLRGFHQAK